MERQAQIVHVPREFLGPHGPPDTPTRHGMGFRQAVDHDGALCKTRQGSRRNMLASVKQRAAVNLIGNQPEIMRLADLTQGHQVVTAIGCTGRVVGRVDHDRTRAWRHHGLNVSGVEMEVPFCPQGGMHHGRTGGLHDRFIGDINRLGHNHLVTVTGNAHDGTIEPTLGAQCHGNIGRTNLLAGLSSVITRNRGLEIRATINPAIVGIATLHLLDHRLCDGLGCFKVGIPNAQDYDVLALSSELHGATMNLPGAGALVG